MTDDGRWTTDNGRRTTMNIKRKQSGMTLMEITVVVAIVALLAVFGLPAIRAFVNSLESKGPTEAMINAALSSARAIAVKEQRYAGIRFQQAYDPRGPLEAPQYMVFIIHDPADRPNGTNLVNGFRAVEGLQPIKLPDSVGVMEVVNSDGEIDDNPSGELTDKTSFSIIFSPSGRLVIHKVQIRNRNGQINDSSKDDIFNVESNVEIGIGMFVQDGDVVVPGLQEEPSRNSFVIYERDKFKAVNKDNRYNGYLKNLEVIYINPYTGTIIERD
jgi:prepilin-type N-terminal cleavage/methylation domain-containing protein